MFEKEFNRGLMTIIEAYLREGKEFRIVLKNKDWEKEIPEEIKKEYPDYIPIDVKNYTLETFGIEIGKNREEDKLILKIIFGEEEYEKKIETKDILGIFTCEGIPIVIKDFEEKESIEEKKEGSKEKSLEMFRRNNKIEK